MKGTQFFLQLLLLICELCYRPHILYVLNALTPSRHGRSIERSSKRSSDQDVKRGLGKLECSSCRKSFSNDKVLKCSIRRREGTYERSRGRWVVLIIAFSSNHKSSKPVTYLTSKCVDATNTSYFWVTWCDNQPTTLIVKHDRFTQIMFTSFCEWIYI